VFASKTNCSFVKDKSDDNYSPFQVSCMSNVCGMFPFFSHDIPDQFYRLFTSLYLHAGILHLAISIAFQHIFLSDLERLLGPLRTAIIYIASGIAGNMTSTILVPYRPEVSETFNSLSLSLFATVIVNVNQFQVGPLASLAGVASSLTIILTFCHWKQLKKPYLALIKLLLIITCLFGMSSMPWQLNFVGIIGGILFGTVLTFGLVPFLSITKYNRKSKVSRVSCD
jgi:membrane associated rhomboid family serine protease